MPYHQEAVGIPWQGLDRRLQTLLLGLMRTTGGGLLATSISIAVLLVIPFRNREVWSMYAIPAIGIICTIPLLYVTIFIRLKTNAHTPIVASAVGIVLIVIGATFSLF
jgi:FtsH-binding integral membrane protein